MNSFARTSIKVGVISAGILLAGSSAAAAGDNWTSSQNTGLLNGLQLKLPVQAPIDVCGNAVGILGGATASCTGGAWAEYANSALTWSTWGNSGIGNGIQAFAPIQVPVDVCGNAIAVLGGPATAHCTGGSWASQHPERAKRYAESAHVTEGSTWVSSGNAGIANGIQAFAPIQIPIDVCGNAVGILGSATASCAGGASAQYSEDGVNQNWNTGLNFGIANGDQIQAIVQVPIDVCGNAISLLGDATAWCKGGSTATIGGDQHPAPVAGPAAHHAAGPAHKPATKPGKGHRHSATEGLPLLGNGIIDGVTGGLRGMLHGGIADGGLGLLHGLTGASSASSDRAGTAARHHRDGYQGTGRCSINWFTSGNSGLLNGVQAFIPVQVPVDISGNAVGVVGDATASSMGGSHAQFC